MLIHTVSVSRWPSELADSRILAKMSEQFSKLGHSVCFITPHRKNKKLSCYGTGWSYYGIQPNSFSLLKLVAINFSFLDFFHLRHLFLNLTTLVSYLMYSIRYTPDIIYSYQKEFTLTKLIHPQTQVVQEFHDIPSDNYQQFWFICAKLLTDLWVTPTKSLQRYLHHAGIPTSKIIITPSGYDQNQFRQISKHTARKHLDLPPHRKIMGYLGNLSGKDGSRGLETVIKSLSFIPTLPKPLFVCVGGDDKQIQPLRQLAKKQQVISQCLFIPQINHQQVPSYLASFDVCLLPFPNTSHYRHFMSPMKMIEYMAAKRPIVSTDLPSVRQILNTQSAIFVSPQSPYSLAQGVIQAFDPTVYKPLVKSAYRQVQQYTWANRARLVLNHLNH